MFAASMSLAQTGSSECVAASLAEEQLEVLRRDPSQVVWDLGAAPGTLVELKAAAGGSQTIAPPALAPSDPSAAKRESALHSRFAWRAYAKVPAPGEGHVELTVIITWLESGKEQSLSVTTAVPRRLVMPQAALAGGTA